MVHQRGGKGRHRGEGGDVGGVVVGHGAGGRRVETEGSREKATGAVGRGGKMLERTPITF